MTGVDASLLPLVHRQFRAARSICKRRVVLPATIDQPSATGKKSAAKSGAQVEISVGQNVLQKSCERRSETPKDKTGRPKYPPPLRVRYPTYEERAGVIRAAKEAGFTSVSGYLRGLSRGPGYKPPRDPELTKALLMLNRELTAQGNNLNQIAKHCNSGGTPAESEGMLGIIGRSMLQTHKAVRTALVNGNPFEEPKP